MKKFVAVAGNIGVGKSTLLNVVAGLEPEEECPILFLRLRKQVERRPLPVIAIAPFASRGFEKLSATVVPTVPGREAAALRPRAPSPRRCAPSAR